MSASTPNAPKTSRHVPVLGRQAVALLNPHDGGIYIDATFGAGGYSRMILDTSGTRVIGIDRDRTAIAGGFDLVDQSAGRLTLVQDRFSNLAEICTAQGQGLVDGIVMDIGVSSMQLDEADRGFSFRLGGPLDMRMGHDGPTAADVVAKASEACAITSAAVGPSWPIRMSSGPPRRNEKPRSASSSCIEDTPTSITTPSTASKDRKSVV